VESTGQNYDFELQSKKSLTLSVAANMDLIFYFFSDFSYLLSYITRAKLQLGARSPGAKQYGDRRTDQPTNEPTDKVSYRGAMLAPKKRQIYMD
jgi:hypothetical protein